MDIKLKKAKKSPKRKLTDLTPEELLDYARKLRSEKADLKGQLDTLENRVAELEMGERSLRSRNVELETLAETRDAEVEQLRQELQTAMDNNTKLQGIIESSDDDISDSVGNRIVDRLDMMIGLMGGEQVPSDDTDDEDDEDEDESEDVEDEDNSERGFDESTFDMDEDEDESEDEDGDTEESALDEPVSVNVQPLEGQAGPAINLPVDHSTAPIHGANVDVDGLTNTADAALRAEAEARAAAQPEGEHSVSVTEDALAEFVVPRIKQEVDSMEGYEDVILNAVRSGDLSKEMALRQMVAKAYPEHADMAESILTAQTVRDKVYETMGL